MKRTSLISGLLCSVLLLLLALRMPPYSQWTIDDGIKRIAAEEGRGRWGEFIPDGEVRARLAEPGRFAPLQPPFATRSDGGFHVGFSPGSRAFFRVLFSIGPEYRHVILAMIAVAAWIGFEFVGIRFAFLLLPLTFYGLTAWEHALSWVLCIPALWLCIGHVFQPHGGSRLAGSCFGLTAFAAGALLGLAVLLRPETAILAVGLAAFTLVNRRMKAGITLSGGVAFALAAFWVVHSASSDQSPWVQLMSNWREIPPLGSFRDSVGERFYAAYVLLLRAGDSVAVTLVLTSMLAAGTWLLYRAGRRRALSVIVVGLLLLAGWMLIIQYRLWSAPVAVLEIMRFNSLFVSMPWVALLLFPPYRSRPLLLLSAGLLAVTLLLTPVWEGVHWGPRILLFAAPVLALELYRSGHARGVVFAALMTLSGLGQVSSAALVYARGREVSDRVMLAERHLGNVVVCPTMSQCVDYAAIWREREFFVAGSSRELRRLLIDLRRAAVDTVWLHTGAGDSLYEQCFPDSRPVWPQRITFIQAKNLYTTQWRIRTLVMNRRDAAWADVLQQEAASRMMEGNPEDALPIQREAVQADPSRASCRSNLAVLLSQLGRADEAQLEAELALQLDPSLSEPRRLLELLDRR